MTRELNAVQKIGVELLKGVFGYETKIVALETTIGGEQGQ